MQTIQAETTGRNNSQEQSFTFRLIDGEFDQYDAKEILMTLIKSKMNYHNLKNFSSEIRYGRPDEHSQKRMSELKETREDLLALLSHTLCEGKTLQINSTIEINILD